MSLQKSLNLFGGIPHGRCLKIIQRLHRRSQGPLLARTCFRHNVYSLPKEDAPADDALKRRPIGGSLAGSMNIVKFLIQPEMIQRIPMFPFIFPLPDHFGR